MCHNTTVKQKSLWIAKNATESNSHTFYKCSQIISIGITAIIIIIYKEVIVRKESELDYAQRGSPLSFKLIVQWSQEY